MGKNTRSKLLSTKSDAEKEQRIKKKYEEMKRKKFVDSFSVKCRCENVKSVGNGL